VSGNDIDTELYLLFFLGHWQGFGAIALTVLLKQSAIAVTLPKPDSLPASEFLYPKKTIGHWSGGKSAAGQLARSH